MKYKKINLPYSTNALEPNISEQTVETHYNKHHSAYEKNFNIGSKDTEIEKFNNIKDVMLNYSSFNNELKKLIKNQGGGLINHDFYWNQFIIKRDLTKKEEEYRKIISDQFNDKKELINEIIEKGLSVFGSGWVWVVIIDGKASVITTPNQENPWMNGIEEVVLGIDLWEHSYYLDYKQDRKTYIENTLNLINL